MKFSKAFELAHSQAELDFVDIDLDTDTPLYICPYAIEIRHDNWSSQCGDHIRSFFNEVLDQLRSGNAQRVEHLLSNLHEPNETYLGESTGDPSGRAIGPTKARDLASAIQNSRAFETGMLADISEAELFIRGIGRDTISDLTTNVIRGLLAQYTAEQCDLHQIEVHGVNTLGPVWNVDTRDWEALAHKLPKFCDKPILLVPKSCVRHQLCINSQEFYNHHMIEFLRSEYQDSSEALVRTFRERRVTKKSVKEKHPLIKDDLAAFVREHPEVLETYKKLAVSKGPLSNADMDEEFDESTFAETLISELAKIPTGPKAASEYHAFIMGGGDILISS